MAFPQASLTPTVSGFGTTHNIAMPAVVDSGDLLLALISHIHLTALNAFPGFILAGSSHPQNFQYDLYVFRKVAVGNEGGTTVNYATLQNIETAAHVYRITAASWHGVTPPEISVFVEHNVVNPDPPPLTPSWGAADTLWIAALSTRGGSDGGGVVTAYPTSYTDGADHGSNALFDQGSHVASARRELSTATEDPGTFTITGANLASLVTIATRPAASVPPPVPSTGGNRMGGTGAIRRPPRTFLHGRN